MRFEECLVQNPSGKASSKFLDIQVICTHVTSMCLLRALLRTA